ncbi:type II toxin-antitoxin system RelE/ParE family toxin [Salegentibacter sp. F188]|uniref:Type II toxin-antitoxin system RelE/ParE family toxin n=1 Tax=Autumnicola patrickiae TaxID=3075591 RepID=A0ABU3E382_9FLAO|nr:type II toxin-antitoxin system RelE/ParE family toxin [Salegentibacter sp. F188]MDT0690442.1 type II toxin-antitoxin system RelE/ParE family toxin [Salegentibacter sp. F188]
MVYSVKFLPAVKHDLSEAKSYYSQKGGIQLANNFKKEVNSEIAYIKQRPEHYQVQYRNLRKALVNRFPYAIFYHVRHQEVIIFAILHTRQDSSKVLNRVP